MRPSWRRGRPRRRRRQKPRGKPPEPLAEEPPPKDQIGILTDEDVDIHARSRRRVRRRFSTRRRRQRWPPAAAGGGRGVRRPTTSMRSSRRWTSSRPRLRRWARPRRRSRTPAHLRQPDVEPAKGGAAARIVMGREPHHPPLAERSEKTPQVAGTPTPPEAMAQHPAEKCCKVGTLTMLRKQNRNGVRHHRRNPRSHSVNPRCAWLFRVRGEWVLVTMALTSKRMFVDGGGST